MEGGCKCMWSVKERCCHSFLSLLVLGGNCLCFPFPPLPPSSLSVVIMGFENLKSPAHLWVLNDSLEDTSYIWGSMSSQANMAEFEAVLGPPPPDLCHAICWYMKWKSLSCDPMDWSPPGSSVHRILQAGILKWVAIPFSKGYSLSRDWTWVSCIGRWTLYCLSHQGSPRYNHIQS